MLAWVMNLDFAAGGTVTTSGSKRKSLLLLKLAGWLFALLFWEAVN